MISDMKTYHAGQRHKNPCKTASHLMKRLSDNIGNMKCMTCGHIQEDFYQYLYKRWDRDLHPSQVWNQQSDWEVIVPLLVREL